MQRTVSRWLIDHDADATRRCYAPLAVGSGCDCNQCRNFDAAAGRTFPPEFVALADAIGMDPAKPAELCHWCREPAAAPIVAARDGRSTRTPSVAITAALDWSSSQLSTAPAVVWTVARPAVTRRRCTRPREITRNRLFRRRKPVRARQINVEKLAY
jgi:hypothetical protein